MEEKPHPPSENVSSRRLVEHAFQLARALSIDTILLQTSSSADIRNVEKHRADERLVWLTPDPQEFPIRDGPKNAVVAMPESPLPRLEQIHLGVFLAVFNEIVGLDQTIICLAGVSGSKRLDTLHITLPSRDYPWFKKLEVSGLPRLFASRELVRLLHIALRFAREGREGKPIGTTFVLGDIELLEPHIHQLILNPCAGHPKRARNIHNPDFLETIRELAVMDGALVVSSQGVLEAADAYLDAPSRGIHLPPGLGARHLAAAAITKHTHAISVVLSESSGTVRVFHDGICILELTRP